MINCENCENCTAIGEGDFICIAEEEPKTVISDYEPTDDYAWCNGSLYEQAGDE